MVRGAVPVPDAVVAAFQGQRQTLLNVAQIRDVDHRADDARRSAFSYNFV